MQNITINITGLNSKQAKVLQQAAGRLEQLATIKETIEKNSKVKKSNSFISYTHTINKPLGDTHYNFLKARCAGDFEVNFCMVVNYNQFDQFNKVKLHFTAIDNNNLHKAIAFVFYNLNKNS